MRAKGAEGASAGPASLSATQAEELDRACDRFEAAWRAGQRPTIEDHLGGATEPLRSALFDELIAVELDRRRRLGEAPAPAEFRDRFPAHQGAVAAAFGLGPTAGRPGPRPRAAEAPAPSPDRAQGLLLGLLAFQNHFIDRDALLAALGAWVADKATPLGQILLKRGALDAATHALLEALAQKHLEAHGGDPEPSLAALALGRSTREVLESFADPDIHATLPRLGQASSPVEWDPNRTASYVVDTAASGGLRFRVLRPHAKGGLGAVFVALDSELNREVALKQILDHHADDPVSRQRFLIEAEITGGLEHPGIVPVYGLGTYGDGRPYYAMRFVKGDSLKEAIERFHADEAPKTDPGRRSLELRKLLRRFTDICYAIDYAHSRGVLHRDLKPGNIIVGKYGETLVVDWGLAKATGQSDPGRAERTLRPRSGGASAETLPGSALGTPAYMSPEQAEGDLEQLGPRSDVYSLGATLYCLLTGQPPFTDGEIDVLLRAVRRGEFRPPRQVDPAIDRALEAVCQKAMARRPQDRYESSRALAEEIERWMADEPVTAWREPFLRRARRWGRRHRTAVTAAVVALGDGFIGLGAVAGIQAGYNTKLSEANAKLIEANAATASALDKATKAQAETEAALAQSEESRKQSEESRKQAEAVSTFLVEAFRSPDPSQDGRKVKVVDVLDRASARLDQPFAGSQATKGALLQALGLTYRGLGFYDQAVSLHTRARAVREAALGADHPDTIASRNSLAVSYGHAQRPGEAIALFESTLKLREAKLGLDHPDTLASRHNLASAYWQAGRTGEAIALHEATLKLLETKLGPDHPRTLGSRHALALAYHDSRPDKAIALYETTLKLMDAKLGPDHPETLHSRIGLASAYQHAGRLSEAIALYEPALKLMDAKLGPDHPETLISRDNLATAYRSAGRTAEAISLHQATLKLLETKLGPDDPITVNTRSALATAYAVDGRLTEAIPLFESTLTVREAKLGPDHPNTLNSRNNLAIAYWEAGRTAEANALHRSTLKLLETKLGPDHPLTLQSRNDLASAAYEDLGRLTEAEALKRAVLARRRKTVKTDSPLLAGDLAGLGGNLLKQSRWSEAEPLLRDCLTIREKVTPDDWSRYDAMSLLGQSLLAQGRYAAAERLVVAGYEGIKAREPRMARSDRSRLREAAERVVRLYERWNKPDQAAAWKAKVGMPDLPAGVFAQP